MCKRLFKQSAVDIMEEHNSLEFDVEHVELVPTHMWHQLEQNEAPSWGYDCVIQDAWKHIEDPDVGKRTNTTTHLARNCPMTSPGSPE
jgi:hypothetical protein